MNPKPLNPSTLVLGTSAFGPSLLESEIGLLGLSWLRLDPRVSNLGIKKCPFWAKVREPKPPPQKKRNKGLLWVLVGVSTLTLAQGRQGSTQSTGLGVWAFGFKGFRVLGIRV